jgi:hypothetical protein
MDLSWHVAHHRPVSSTHRVPGGKIVTRWEAANPFEPCLDQIGVSVHNTGFRVAVVDPALCGTEDHRRAVLSGGIALAVAHSVETLDTVFADANAVLYHPWSRRATDSSVTCLAVVDIDNGTVTAGRAGDCEIWVDNGAGFEPLLAGDALTQKARERFTTHGAPQQPDRRAHLESHDTLLGDIDDWKTAPLGMFHTAKPQYATATGVTRVLVTTDGVGTCANFTDLDSLWERVHDRPANWPHPNPHGDLAVAVITLDG